MELIMDAIRAVRTRRAEMNVPPSKKAHLHGGHRGAGHLYRWASPSSSGWPMPAR